jgi:hypothetical protein
MRRQAATTTDQKESCGNAAAVESVESQRRASPSFHEPLGNLAKGGRDSHIPTAPATKRMEKCKTKKQVFHFPTAPNPRSHSIQNQRGRASPSAHGRALRAA